MADTTFTSGTIIASTWLNDLNDLFYTTLNGATTAAGVRSAVSAAQSGANSDITSLTGLTTPLSVAQGGTASTTASAARTALGAAASGANSDLTSLTGLTTPLSVAQGGTGAATLASNNVVLGNGTSAVQLVAPSTSGNVLTSNGTTWTSATPTGPGLVLISATTISGSPSSVNIENFSSTYDEYLLVISNLEPNGNPTLEVRFKIGGSYLSGANYSYFLQRCRAAGPDFLVSNSTSATSLLLSQGLTAFDAHNIDMRIHSVNNSSRIKRVTWSGATETAAGDHIMIHGMGTHSTTGALQGIQVLTTTGAASFSSGAIYLYGFKKS